jgi:hypothetical protein
MESVLKIITLLSSGLFAEVALYVASFRLPFRPKQGINWLMPHGPFLIFDKSSLESLNLDEAVLIDNFYEFEP